MWLGNIVKKESKIKIRRNEIACVLLYICLGCAFYIMNVNVSLRNDDFIYSFVFTDEPFQFAGQKHSIQNLADIFISQYNHYLLMNGRTPVHFFIQLFCGIWGKSLFDIVNSIVYIAFIIGTTKLIFGNKSSFFHYLGISSLTWILLPVSVFYASGISFAINYLWSLTICIWFLLLYEKVKETKLSNKSYLCFLLVSFLAGWSHESFSIGIAGALFFHLILYYNKCSVQEIGIIIAFCLGVVMIIIAPGTWKRLNDLGGPVIFSEFIFSRIGILFLMKRLGLLIVCIIVLAILKKINLFSLYKENTLLVCILSFEVFFIMALGIMRERALLGIDFFSFVLIVRILFNLSASKYKCWKYYTIPLFFFFGYVVVNLINVLSVVNKEFTAIIEGYLNDKNGITYQYKVKIPSFYNKYVNRLYPKSWEVDAISLYYGKTMHLFPETYKTYFSQIASYLQPEYKVDEGAGLYEIPGTGIYMTYVDPCDKTYEYRYKFEYMPIMAQQKFSFLQMWNRMFYQNLYHQIEIKVRPIEIDGKCIIFIDNGMYKKRVLKKVVLEKDIKKACL